MGKILHRLEIEIPTILRRATKLLKSKVLMQDAVARPNTWLTWPVGWRWVDNLVLGGKGGVDYSVEGFEGTPICSPVFVLRCLMWGYLWDDFVWEEKRSHVLLTSSIWSCWFVFNQSWQVSIAIDESSTSYRTHKTVISLASWRKNLPFYHVSGYLGFSSWCDFKNFERFVAR